VASPRMGVGVGVIVWVCWGNPKWLPYVGLTLAIPLRYIATPWIYPWEATPSTNPGLQSGVFCPHLQVGAKKKEAALPQHYLSPNQIKPNYIFRKTSSRC